MAILIATAGRDDVYQIETGDPVQGGAGGIDNRQAQANLNRTEDLYNKNDARAAETAANASAIADLQAADSGMKLKVRAEVDVTGAISAIVKASGVSNPTSQKFSAGYFRVTHNLNLATSLQKIDLNTLYTASTKAVKIASVLKTPNYFEVYTADDASLNSAPFEFFITEITL